MNAHDTHERWHPGESDEYLRAAIGRVNGECMNEHDAIERVAQAIAEEHGVLWGPGMPDVTVTESIPGKDTYRRMARAALAALGDVERVADWLPVQHVEGGAMATIPDVAPEPLENVLGDEMYIDIAMVQRPGHCVASVTTFEHPDITPMSGHGTGPTIDAAIRNAIAVAKATKGGDA